MSNEPAISIKRWFNQIGEGYQWVSWTTAGIILIALVDNKYVMITPGEYVRKVEDKPKIEITPEKRKEVNAFFSKLEVGDLCFMEVMEYGLALFGQTKAGKTTLAHYLINNPLVGNQDQCYELKGGSRFLQAIIGQQLYSQTEIPNEVAKKLQAERAQKGLEIHILDCPGYTDSKGCHMVIANGYFHYRIFSKVKNLKFVITLDYKHMSGVYDKPVITLVEFLMSFKELHQVKKEIFDATTFVFTKLERLGQSEEEVRGNIVSKLINLRNCGSLNNSQLRQDMRELIDIIVGRKRFFFFERAVENTYAASNKLLQQINDCTSFWSRNISPEDNEADMSNIQMTLGNRARQMAENHKKFKEDFQALMQVFKERFSRAFLSIYEPECSLQRITVQFLINSLLGKAKQKSFYEDHILKFISSFNIYRTNEFNSKQEYEKKRKNKKDSLMKAENSKIDSLQIQNIQKLEICKMIIEMTQNKENVIGDMNMTGRRSLESYKKICKDILGILAQFKKIRFFNFMQEKAQVQEYTQKIEEFIYIVYRLLQQARTFKIIFETDSAQKLHNNSINTFSLQNVDITRIIFDYIQSLTDENYDYISMAEANIFEKCKYTYLANHFEVACNGTENYYQEIEEYFKLPKNGLEKQKQLKNSVVEKMNKIINEKLNSIHNKKVSKSEKVLALMQYAKNKLYLLENGKVLSDYDKNMEVYLETVNKLASEITAIDPKGQEDKEEIRTRLKIAIKIFKSTSNVYKAIQAYTLLSKKYDIEKEAVEMKEMLMEFAEFASTHGRIELAIDKYQQAYSLIDWMYNNSQDQFHNLRRKHREEIAGKIGMLGVQKRYNPSMSYYDSLLRKKLFVIVDAGVFDEIKASFAKKK